MRFLLIDISNSFTKIALSSRKKVGKIYRIPTKELTERRLQAAIKHWSFQFAIAASVVPSRNSVIEQVLRRYPFLWVTPEINLGVGIDYPHPEQIGGDRLANTAACVGLYGSPAIVVDFGTAVTFDVISSAGNYIGGVIAPGMAAFTEYLHSKTALLPYVALREPQSVVGKSSEEAVRSGAVIGYRGLVREIITQIRQEIFPRKRRALKVLATGGDAKLIGSHLPLFDVINPKLTLEGLRLIALKNFAIKEKQSNARK